MDFRAALRKMIMLSTKLHCQTLATTFWYPTVINSDVENLDVQH